MESTSSAGSRSATPSRNGSPGGVIASQPQRPWTHAKCDHRPPLSRARPENLMRIVATPPLASSLLPALLIAGCQRGPGADRGDAPEASVPADMGPDAARPLVPPGFETFCAGKDATLTAEVT